MINIRVGCWETNSSSNHTIIITDDDRPYDLKNWRVHKHSYEDEIDPDSQGYHIGHASESNPVHYSDRIKKDRLVLSNIRFGKGYDIFTDWISKVEYAIASLCVFSPWVPERDDWWEIHRPGVSDLDVLEDIEKLIHKHIPKLKGIYRSPFYRGGRRDYYIEEHWCDIINSGIFPWEVEGGHFLFHFLEDAHVSLEDFIFNRRYLLVTDSDELFVFRDRIQHGLITIEHIKAIYEPYEKFIYKDGIWFIDGIRYNPSRTNDNINSIWSNH